MDNDSGHDATAISALLDIDWLPPNATARFQPSEQAMIRGLRE